MSATATVVAGAPSGARPPASVPLQPVPLPATLVADGVRLDSRSLEEFRPVCECVHDIDECCASWASGVPAAAAVAAASRSPYFAAPLRCTRADCCPCTTTSSPPTPPVLDTGVVSRAAGSAYAEFGATRVVAAVYGPRPAERRLGFTDSGRLRVEAAFASFARRERERQAQVRGGCARARIGPVCFRVLAACALP